MRTRKNKTYSRKIPNRTRKIYKGGNLEIVNEIFSDIKVDKDYDNIYEITCGTNHGKSSGFSIYEDRIDLNELSSCDDITGSSILEKIITLSKRLRKNIELYDSSTIHAVNSDCSYSLALFSILRTGKSWYNKHGFMSLEHYDNVEYNTQFLNLSLSDFMILAKDNYVSKKTTIFLTHEFSDLNNINNEYKKHESIEILKKVMSLKFHSLIDSYVNIIKTHGSLANYKSSTLEKIAQHELLNIDKFIAAYDNLDFTADTNITTIIQLIYPKLSREPTCDDKFMRLSELVNSSEYILHYKRQLIYDWRTSL